MKFAATYVVCNVPSLACVGIAGALAVSGQEGWGYFLFGAVLLHTSLRHRED